MVLRHTLYFPGWHGKGAGCRGGRLIVKIYLHIVISLLSDSTEVILSTYSKIALSQSNWEQARSDLSRFF